MAMRSIYIGQLVQSAAAFIIIHTLQFFKCTLYNKNANANHPLAENMSYVKFEGM